MKLKRTVALVLALIMTAVMLPTARVSAAKHGKITYHVVDECAVIVAYDNTFIPNYVDPLVRIPDTLGDYPVTEIAESAFQNCRYFKSIILPDSITKIGTAAFKDCSMESITLPANLTTIGDEAFSGCRNLKNIVLPEGIISIGSDAFEMCTMLEDITFPDSLKVIGDYAFLSCNRFRNVVFPKDLESLGLKPVSGQLIQRVVLPDCITELPDNYFSSCPNLRSVEFTDELTKIGNNVFKGTMLESFTIPHLITEVHDYMFEGCEYLTTVVLHDGITRIGEGAFNHCYSLKDLYIPASVTEIGNIPFGYTVIENYEVDGNNPVYSTVDGLLTTKDGKTMLPILQAIPVPSIPCPRASRPWVTPPFTACGIFTALPYPKE
ncbi:MAG: leucine-rich repeat domain-containing protein [Clostridia bacterium]|nr:leucine-rich repeat domain-containing protein [Clostridia bacterium]